MIHALAVLLLFQLVGETLARAFLPVIPGPVLGMAMMLLALVAAPRLADAVRPAALGLLGHLSLLFVPAGVGIVSHAARLGPEAAALGVALVVSTLAAVAAGALVFVAVARMTGDRSAKE